MESKFGWDFSEKYSMESKLWWALSDKCYIESKFGELSMINILWNQSLDKLSLIIVLLARKKAWHAKNTNTCEETKILYCFKTEIWSFWPVICEEFMAPHIDIMPPPQVPFRVRDGQRYCCSCRCCRRIRRDCTRKPLRLTCNHKICTYRLVWGSENVKKVIIGPKRGKNEDPKIHFMKELAKICHFELGLNK